MNQETSVEASTECDAPTITTQETLYETHEDLYSDDGVRDVIDYSLDKDGVLVHEKHPIIDLIQKNQEEYPVDVENAKRWIRLERKLVQACCARLQSK